MGDQKWDRCLRLQSGFAQASFELAQALRRLAQPKLRPAQPQLRQLTHRSRCTPAKLTPKTRNSVCMRFVFICYSDGIAVGIASDPAISIAISIASNPAIGIAVNLAVSATAIVY
jgi:hypothetical protein